MGSPTTGRDLKIRGTAGRTAQAGLSKKKTAALHRPSKGGRGRTGMGPLARPPRPDMVGLRVRPVPAVVLAPAMAPILEVAGRVAARNTTIPKVYGVAPRTLGVMVARAAPTETAPAYEVAENTFPVRERSKVALPARTFVALMPQETEAAFDALVPRQEVKVTPWPVVRAVPSERKGSRLRSAFTSPSAVRGHVALYG